MRYTLQYARTDLIHQDAALIERRKLESTAHSAWVLEGVENAGHLSELDRAFEVSDKPQLLEVRNVAEVPDDRTHERIVLRMQVRLGERLNEVQGASARFAQLGDDVVSHHE